MGPCKVLSFAISQDSWTAVGWAQASARSSCRQVISCFSAGRPGSDQAELQRPAGTMRGRSSVLDSINPTDCAPRWARLIRLRSPMMLGTISEGAQPPMRRVKTMKQSVLFAMFVAFLFAAGCICHAVIGPVFCALTTGSSAQSPVQVGPIWAVARRRPAGERRRSTQTEPSTRFSACGRKDWQLMAVLITMPPWLDVAALGEAVCAAAVGRPVARRASRARTGGSLAE